jgi:hypothetical protein
MMGLNGYGRLALVFWALAVIAIVVWGSLPGTLLGWDLHVYVNAIRAMRAGHDPYLDGIAVQRAFHGSAAYLRNDPPPYTYVYSPLTLPVLRWVGTFPLRVTGTIYWLLYVPSVFVPIWVGMQFVEENERKAFALIAPAAVFFPGLLQNDVLFSGNIAFLFYALVLLSALRGWRRGRWGWFYIAVLAASCCKAPMLSLVAIPVLSAKRQWLAAGLTGAVGVVLFAMQPHVWPALFRNYLEAVELQFSYNHDFGISPAGLLADALYYVVPYQKTSLYFYLFYAVLFAWLLLYLRGRFLAGEIAFKQWIPLMLIGVILLNPRIMEYDVAPLAIPMALVAWRVCTWICRSNTQAIVLMSVLFAIANACAPFDAWRTTECVVLIVLFAAGSAHLWIQARDVAASELVVTAG